MRRRCHPNVVAKSPERPPKRVTRGADVPRTKPERTPLLAPGRHTMTLMDIKALAVDCFPQSAKRRLLWQEFEALMQETMIAGFPCEVWIDGSFLTEEENPADVDFSFHVDVSVMSVPTDEMRFILDRFDDGACPGALDGFVCTSYPRGHERFGTQLDGATEWAEHWGVSYDSKWCKGIAVLRLGEMDVGLRLSF